ncbi:MAG: hypothetical protein MMC33_008460 [Icmadophila ericetorum]|nr:hypothetical protein [Icmadophila ericetorum]
MRGSVASTTDACLVDAGLQPLQGGLVVRAALGQHHGHRADGAIGGADRGAEGLVPRHPAPARRLQCPGTAHDALCPAALSHVRTSRSHTQIICAERRYIEDESAAVKGDGEMARSDMEVDIMCQVTLGQSQSMTAGSTGQLQPAHRHLYEDGVGCPARHNAVHARDLALFGGQGRVHRLQGCGLRPGHLLAGHPGAQLPVPRQRQRELQRVGAVAVVGHLGLRAASHAQHICHPRSQTLAIRSTCPAWAPTVCLSAGTT